ncbi:hypothetical protein J6590_015030 [Homalodisca vitripennis]|nr:hypothetical protein J6590_015030 [Homalodisca vitripennis]
MSNIRAFCRLTIEDRAKSHWTFFVVHFIPDDEFFVISELALMVRPLSGLQKMPARLGNRFIGVYSHRLACLSISKKIVTADKRLVAVISLLKRRVASVRKLLQLGNRFIGVYSHRLASLGIGKKIVTADKRLVAAISFLKRR